MLAPSRPDKGRIVLLDDSHALRLLPLLGELHRRDGWGVIAYAAEGNTYPAIPYSLSNGRDRNQWQKRQSHFNQFLLRLLEQLGQGVVLLLKSWVDLYLVEDEFFARARSDPQLEAGNGSTIETSEAQRQWIRRLERLADLTGRGVVPVVVMAPHPVFPGSLETVPSELCLPMWFRPNLPATCPATFRVDRAQAMRRIEPLLQELRRAAARHPHLLLFEPFHNLCPTNSTECAAFRNGKVLYTDNNHFSRAGSLSLLQPFRSFLKRNGLRAQTHSKDNQDPVRSPLALKRNSVLVKQ